MTNIHSLFIVDDHDLYRLVTKQLIETSTLVKKVVTFPDGEKAIESLKASKEEDLPEVIFLDISMPVMDGWEFLDEFKRIKSTLGKKITIYIISSSINPADIERAKSISEVTDFIIKPLTKQKFIDIITNFD